jgi:proteasome assembly chaperone (PAC2) family protein
MDPVHRYRRPNLRRPVAVVAFEGWNDACEAASGAAAYLLGQFTADPYAVVEPEDFFDFQVSRPTVEVDGGQTQNLTWPETRLFDVIVPEAPRDLVVVLGEEPNLRWKTFSRLIAQLLGEADVELVVTLGAFIGQVAHTLPVPIVGVATDPDLLESQNLLTSHYEGPTGINGVLLEACREVGIPTIGLWAAAPHYLAANPNPKAMLALLDKAASIIGMAVDTAELGKVTQEFESKVATAMGSSDDLSDYVRRLESAAAQETGVDRADLSPKAGHQLIEELEEFLRSQD